MVSHNPGTMNLPTSSSVDSGDLSLMVQELRELGFDAIRFASYRTSAKLRFIQKKSNIAYIDIWNVIEAIRDTGLNAVDPFSVITVPKLESMIMSLYVNLNKRLPPGQQVDNYSCSRYLLCWLLIAYDSEGSGRIRVFSVKVGLVTLCNGKLIDKLRYIFSQISDGNGNLIFSKFSEYLREVLALPTMVLESPTFGYTEGIASTIFDGTSKIFVNGFLDAVLSDPGPPCLMWMPLLHAMAAVEEVNHPVKCNVCRSASIQGFRYKCQKCSNFNMCQNCFWQGKTSENHRTEHEVKEYSTFKPSGKSLRNSFRRSFRCVPAKSKKMDRFPDEPEKILNLSHIVPPSPLPPHNGFPAPSYDSLDAYSDHRMFAEMGYGPNKMPSYAESVSESDEEHRLIARYTARLASESKYPLQPAPMHKTMQHSRTMSQNSMGLYDTTQTQRDMIAQLEARNREIMREIARLRVQQEMDYMNGEPAEPMVMEELQALRYHKSDLEDKLTGLQDSRRSLMGQMESLMKLLKAQQFAPNSSSPHSTRSPSTPLYGGYGSGTMSLHRSAPATPHHHSDHFSSMAGDLRSAFGGGEDISTSLSNIETSGASSVRYLRNDLLLAADSVTNAMSSLVKELNSGSDEEGLADMNGHIMKPLGMNGSPGNGDVKHSPGWNQNLEKRRLEEEEKYLEELRNLRLSEENVSGVGHAAAASKPDGLYARPNGDKSNGPNDFNRRDRGFPTEEESIFEPDEDDSFVKTKEQTGAAWDDGLKNWTGR